jgi:hypothetical protein
LSRFSSVAPPFAFTQGRHTIDRPREDVSCLGGAAERGTVNPVAERAAGVFQCSGASNAC